MIEQNLFSPCVQYLGDEVSAKNISDGVVLFFKYSSKLDFKYWKRIVTSIEGSFCEVK